MDKVRIQEIAGEAGATNADLIKKARELGYDVKASNSTLTVDQAGILIDYVMSGIKPKNSKKKIINKSNKNTDIKKITISISNLKNIKKFEWEFELKKGVKAINGFNGVGKSSLITVLGKLIYSNVFNRELIGIGYENTKIQYLFEFEDNKTEKFIWYKPKNWQEKNSKKMEFLDGFFESSVLEGKRFRIYENLKRIKINKDDKITSAPDFIQENMDYIIFGNEKNSEKKFENLYFISKKIQQRIKPYEWYALKIEEQYIHEYFFSTGEFFLLSLLKFIYKLINPKNKQKVSMIIIDEIELSLHTEAQKRLVEKLTKFSKEYNILVIFTTHSLKLIEKMKPDDIYWFKNTDGDCSLSSKYYPKCLTSELETHNGYDRIILVEDKLAGRFVEKFIEQSQDLKKKKLDYKILPLGGWENTINTAVENKIFKFYSADKILVLLDEDIRHEVDILKLKDKTHHEEIEIDDEIKRYIVKNLLLKHNTKIAIPLNKNNKKKLNLIDFISNEFSIEPIKNNYNELISNKVIKNDKDIKNNYDEFISKIIELSPKTIEKNDVEQLIKKYLIKKLKFDNREYNLNYQELGYIPVSENIEKYVVLTLSMDNDFREMLNKILRGIKFTSLDIDWNLDNYNTKTIKTKFDKLIEKVVEKSELSTEEVYNKIILFIIENLDQKKKGNFTKKLNTFFE